NIAVALDYTGQLLIASANITTATIGTLTLSGALSASSITTPQLTIQGDVTNDAGMIPDLIGTVRGTNGAIVSGYDVITGRFNTVGLDIPAGGSVTIGGTSVQVAAATAPTDAIDIRAAAYGAKGDGTRNHGYVTTSGSTLTITNFSGTLSLAMVDATTAQVTIASAQWSGWAFQPHHEGRLLYLTAPAGYTLTARVKPRGYIDGQNVLIDITGQAITVQSNAAGTVTVPAVDITQ